MADEAAGGEEPRENDVRTVDGVLQFYDGARWVDARPIWEPIRSRRERRSNT
jgi:hypothetical protein